jgi:hypothetical protein
MKKMLSTFIALTLFAVITQAQTKTTTTRAIHKPTNNLGGQEVGEVRSTKAKVSATSITRKPANNLGGQDVARKPATKTSAKRHN